jgi:hypothetical protein
MAGEVAESWDAIRTLVRFAISVFVMTCVAVVAAIVALVFLAVQQDASGVSNTDGVQLMTALAPMAASSLATVGHMVAPLIQLFVVLVVIEWFLRRMGVNTLSGNVLKGLEWNTQTLVAVLVIGSFSVAALGGLTTGLSALKDLALVVVGFYFGTQRRVLEVETEQGKVRHVVEHQNDRVTLPTTPSLSDVAPPEER